MSKTPLPKKVVFGAPPPDYIPGWGRGAVSFITSSNLRPSQDCPHTRIFGAVGDQNGDCKNSIDYSETNFETWLGNEHLSVSGSVINEEGREADNMSRKFHEFMDTRRRESEVNEDMKKFHKEKPTLIQQLKDAKRQLSNLKSEDWMVIPEAIDRSVKKVKRAEKYVPVLDKLTDSARKEDTTVNMINPSEGKRPMAGNMITAEKESDNSIKIKNLNGALECSSTDLDLWKQLVELRMEDEANIENIDNVIKRGIKVLMKEGVIVNREVKEVELAEKAGSILTCDAIVKYTADLGVDQDDRERVWQGEAELCIARGSLETARALYKHLTTVSNTNTQNWVRAIEFEKEYGDAEKQAAVLEKAIMECPKSGELWALAIELVPRHLRIAKSVEAMKNCNHDPYVILAVAKLFWKERKFEKTEKWLKRCVLTSPDYGDGWIYYYMFKKERGKLEEAEQILERCKETDSYYGRLWISVAKKVQNWRLTTQETIQEGIKTIGNEFEVAE